MALQVMKKGIFVNTGETSKIQHLDTEIVVVGAGGAGLAAAVTAAENGARVIVLEKRLTVGGNSLMAEGLFAAESEFQNRLGIDARRDELFRMAMDYSHWKINQRIVRAYIDKSGDTVQWLADRGAKLDHILAVHPNQVLHTWHCHPKRGGPQVVKALAKICKERGVRLLYQTPAKKILVSKKGSVTGVLAAKGEQEIRIPARSVIIGTGGYGGNKELLKKYYPYYNENVVLLGAPNKGDGLLMSTEIGAATEGLGLLMLMGPRFQGSPSTVILAREPNTVWVNRKGERFIDEAVTLSTERANALDRQPEGISYTLFDEKIKQQIIEKGFINMGLFILPQMKKTELENDITAEANKKTLKISGSWEEIAGWIGAVPEALKATIADYNFFCKQGYDEAFFKDRRYLQPLCTPPYYAMKCTSALLVTVGGIKINHHMEVLDQQDNPIPGLYAVGIDAGGWQGDTYCLELSGFAFGFAVNSGRIAGEHALGSSSSQRAAFSQRVLCV